MSLKSSQTIIMTHLFLPADFSVLQLINIAKVIKGMPGVPGLPGLPGRPGPQGKHQSHLQTNAVCRGHSKGCFEGLGDVMFGYMNDFLCLSVISYIVT